MHAFGHFISFANAKVQVPKFKVVRKPQPN